MSKFSEVTEAVKNIIEAVAIVGAGIWAIFIFKSKESPDLHKATLVETVISIDSIDKNTVLMNVMSKLTNKGEKTLAIDSGEIAYWLVPRDSIIKKPYFSVEDYMFYNNSNYTVIFTTLNGIYTSGQDYSQYFDFPLKRDSNLAVIARTSLFSKTNNRFGESSPLYSYDYQLHCLPATIQGSTK